MTLSEELARLPDGWGYVAVDDQKRPYQTKWQERPLDKASLQVELEAGSAKAIGVCCGVPSGGLLFLDHDGRSASTILRDWGCPMSSLPRSWTVTSGRDGRFQVIYRVPEQYWPDIATRKYKSGVTDSEGKPEQIELRWTGCQSVVAGAHPTTTGYHWITKYSPEDLDLAEAPLCLIEKMLKPVAQPAPLLVASDDAARARSYLEALSGSRADDYDDWLAVGMALHSVGDDTLLDDWEHWSSQSNKHKPSDCQRKWRSFKKSGISLGTLGDMAKKDGWRSQRQEPSRGVASGDGKPPIITKPEKLETAELLALLRSQADEIRYNVFTQQIEIKEKAIDGADRFYLKLAEMGYKVGKELAIDCLVQVANENPYNPVTEYLLHCERHVEPTYIDGLATAYLRPGDDGTTIYDEMLKRTLIGAVARAFDPGYKHDTACVIMGDQGAYKSSFWGCLGGPFYSDALGDISTKDDVMVLHRSWIMEWAELDHITNRKHAGQVKAFLSQAIDLLRVPYGKAVEAFPRRGIIVGTTNKTTGFLVDETGNRRFWVIPTTKTQVDQINTAALLMERDAIWSAAVYAYRNGETNRLPVAMELAVQQENDAYMIESPWRLAILTYLADRRSTDVLTSEEILAKAIQKPMERQTKVDQMQVASILKELGWTKRRESSGKRRWYYQLDDQPKG
ncbi:MAG: VapE domain-containing protein [Aquiluna sp.]